MNTMKANFATIHDILLLHAVAVTIIMGGILQLWNASRNSDQAFEYLQQVGCTYALSSAVPSAVDELARECLAR